MTLFNKDNSSTFKKYFYKFVKETTET